MRSAVCALFAAAFLIGAVSSRAEGLTTAIYVDSPEAYGLTTKLAFDRIVATGATAVRFTVYWSDVAPAEQPKTWGPANPADSHYHWGILDSEIRQAVAHKLQPLITIMAAPRWAQATPPKDFREVGTHNSYLPDPQEFGEFTTAVAKRYSGSFRGLPRVRWWQAWNEPNLSLYLVPQLQDNAPVSPGWYRKMLNRFAAAVRGVHRDNIVVAGGLAPFRDISGYVVAQDSDWGPLSFMRDLLCVSQSLEPTCSAKTSFDVWAQHPYTSGGPLHHAQLPNDVSLGDLPAVRAVLHAAERAHHIDSRGVPKFWVTEFSWDTDPPDPKAVPTALHQRWVAEALYRMWRNGVSLVTWLMLRDDPVDGGLLQSGLYYRGATLAEDRPKPSLEAFRFPVVAFPSRGTISVWGRTPAGRSGQVLVQQSFDGGWRNLRALRTDRNGIFELRVRGSASGFVRARLISSGETSVPFSLHSVPDQTFNPFGSETLIKR